MGLSGTGANVPPGRPGDRLVRLARNAMATRFEIALYGDDPVRLRAAGEEALAEIERIEEQLSLFRPESEIAHLNARTSEGPTRVTPSLFRLLAEAKRLSALTLGTFDLTVGPLMRAWGFRGGGARVPSPDALAAALACVGMDLIALDDENCAVRFIRQGVALDLGAFGKGYAVARAAGLLRENGIDRALIHGGSSTATAVGAPPGSDGWLIAVQHPLRADERIGTIQLRDRSLSVSAVHGQAFEEGGRRYGHVLDPRSGQPVDGPLLAAVVLPSATETDALSTALLVLGESGPSLLAGERPEIRALVALEDPALPDGLRIAALNWPDR